MLRRYQQSVIKKMIWALEMGGNSVISMPTGSGKTHIISGFVDQTDTPVLILAPTKELIEQNLEKLEAVVDRSEIGVYSASMNEKIVKRYTLATIGSIYKKPELFDHYEVVIVDECHLISPKKMSGMYNKFFRAIKPRAIFGLTATPFRQDVYYDFPGGWKNYKGTRYQKMQIEAVTTTKMLVRYKEMFWDRMLCVINTQQLIDKDYLCELDYDLIDLVKHTDIPLNVSKSDFDIDAFEQLLSDKEQLLITKINEISNNHKNLLVFCSSIKQAKLLSGVKNGSDYVDSTMTKKQRSKAISDFRTGKTKVMFNVGILTCIMDDMEILTKNNGWVGINQISGEDDVAQYNKETGVISFAKPERIVRKKVFRGKEMIRLDGRYQSFTVTPTHNMLISKRKGSKIEKISAKNCVNKRWFLPVSGFAEKEKIIVPQEKTIDKSKFIATNSFNYRKKGMSKKRARETAESEYLRKSSLKYKNPDELTLDECRLIGFWLGDGSVSRSTSGGNRYAITQSLSTPRMVAWVDDLLNKTKIDHSRYEHKSKATKILGHKTNTSGHVVWNLSIGTGGNKQHRNGIYRLLPYLNKNGSPYYWGLDRNQFWALVEGLWMADGWHGNHRRFDGSKIYGVTKELFDLLQAIGVSRGFRSTIKEVKKNKRSKKQMYSISFTDKRFHQMSNDRMKKINLERDGEVWCVTMPEGTIIARDKGSVTIMGNTGFDMPELEAIALIRPTRSLNLYNQMLGRLTRKADNKEVGMVYDFSGTVRTLGRLETIEVKKVEGKWDVVSETFEDGFHHKKLYSWRVNR